jgi:hypothetical protein
MFEYLGMSNIQMVLVAVPTYCLQHFLSYVTMQLFKQTQRHLGQLLDGDVLIRSVLIRQES